MSSYKQSNINTFLLVVEGLIKLFVLLLLKWLSKCFRLLRCKSIIEKRLIGFQETFTDTSKKPPSFNRIILSVLLSRTDHQSTDLRQQTGE